MHIIGVLLRIIGNISKGSVLSELRKQDSILLGRVRQFMVTSEKKRGISFIFHLQVESSLDHGISQKMALVSICKRDNPGPAMKIMAFIGAHNTAVYSGTGHGAFYNISCYLLLIPHSLIRMASTTSPDDLQ
jgi:hypothetical protein